MKKFAIIVVIGASAFGAYYFLSLSAKPKPAVSNKNLSTTMTLTSPSFHNQESIPQKFTCDGGDISPELQVQNVPTEAKSLALIVDDPDATGGVTFTHWLVWNIAASKEASLAPSGRDPIIIIKEDSVPPGAVEGKNDFPKVGYGGPCPPRGSKPHRYFFKLYALSSMLNLKEGAGKAELESEIQKYLLDKTELIGLYGR